MLYSRDVRPHALVLVAGLLSGMARAQTFPPTPTNGTVYDGARLLSAQDVATINTVSRRFQRDTGAPIVVATFPSLESVGAKRMGIERYSTDLFNAWRIGHRQEGGNGGILLVVAKADRKVRIELGRDWRRGYDAGARRVDQETILPAFRSGDFAGGIVRGCEALANLSTTPQAPNAPPPPGFGNGSTVSEEPMAIPSGMTQESSDGFPGGLLCLGAPILLLMFIAGAFARRRRAWGYGRGYGPTGPYVNSPSDDDGFLTGMAVGQMMSQPTYDPGPSYDTTPSYDPGPSMDSGGFDSGGSFDSGSSGGGGDTGSW